MSNLTFSYLYLKQILLEKHIYKAFGLNIYSEFEIPELSACDESDIDVWIKFGKVPEKIQNITGQGVLFEASFNEFLFKLDSIAKYYVKNGSQIVIQPDIGASDKDIRLFLLGSVFGALFHQRGMLAMHGSSIMNEEYTTIFTGHSSVGKSTLASMFQMLGYKVITDDITVINTSESDKLTVFPGSMQLKLWHDAVVYFNKEPYLEKVRPKIEKYIIPIDSPNKTLISAPVKKILLLSTSNSKKYNFNEIFGADKFRILSKNTYRVRFAEKMRSTEKHFNNISLLSDAVRLYRVERPNSTMQIQQLAEYVECNILA